MRYVPPRYLDLTKDGLAGGLKVVASFYHALGHGFLGGFQVRARVIHFLVAHFTIDLQNPEVAFAIESACVAGKIAQTIQASMNVTGVEKKDLSPVTVADFTCQALVARALNDRFPEAVLVGEEDSGVLRDPEQIQMAVVQLRQEFFTDVQPPGEGRRKLHESFDAKEGIWLRAQLHSRGAGGERFGGKLKILNPRKRVQDSLALTKLLPIFEVFEDQALAVASFTEAD